MVDHGGGLYCHNVCHRQRPNDMEPDDALERCSKDLHRRNLAGNVINGSCYQKFRDICQASTCSTCRKGSSDPKAIRLIKMDTNDLKLNELEPVGVLLIEPDCSTRSNQSGGVSRCHSNPEAETVS